MGKMEVLVPVFTRFVGKGTMFHLFQDSMLFSIII